MIGGVERAVPERVYAAAEAALERALSLYAGSPQAVDWLEQHAQRMTEPLRIVVTGRRGAGKSTVLNALVGEEVAHPETRLPTWYLDGPAPQAFAVSPSRPVQELPLADASAGGRAAGPTLTPPDAEKIVVEWPSRSLRGVVLIDTPGPDVLSPDDPTFPELQRTLFDADAVIHLAEGPAAANADFLASAHDSPLSRATAVSTIVVLSRADEVGGGRIDAMTTARQLARRAARSEVFGPLTQAVLPLSGLLAQGARTLREEDFAALAAVGRLSKVDQDRVTLSVDRFLAAAQAIGHSPAVHQELLRRLGLFGVRLAGTLIRQGYGTQTKLVAELVQRSGLAELRDSIAVQFTGRYEVLKARSALLGLDTLLRADPVPQAQELVVELQRIVASAHEFRELRLLAALRSGRAALAEDAGAEAAQLIGAHGAAAAERLGTPEDAGREELLRTAALHLDRWRLLAEDPLAARAAVEVAHTVVRTCEGLIVDLAR